MCRACSTHDMCKPRTKLQSENLKGRGLEDVKTRIDFKEAGVRVGRVLDSPGSRSEPVMCSLNTT
jgi:hypothetical protein